MLRAKKPATGELLDYAKNGNTFWANFTANPVLDDSQKLIWCIVVETDVTAHKESEQKITSIARDLSDLIENANALFFEVDRNLM